MIKLVKEGEKVNYKKLIKKFKLLFIFLLIFQLIFQSLQVPLVFGNETNEKLKFHEDIQRNNKVIKIEKDKENNLKFKLEAKDVKVSHIKLIHQKSLKLTESSTNYLKNLGYNIVSSNMDTVCERNENFESIDLEVSSKDKDKKQDILISELQLEQIKNPKPQKITNGDVFAIVIYTDQGYYYDYAELSDSDISSMIEKGVLEEWRHFNPKKIINHLKSSEDSNNEKFNKEKFNKEEPKNKGGDELKENVSPTTNPEIGSDSSSNLVAKPKKRNIPFALNANGYYYNYGSDYDDDENYGEFYQKLVDASSTYENTEFYKENKDNPLGIMGGFHLVGFGTVTTKAHTNGNILANELIYQNNFGTNDLKEVSYIKNLRTSGAITAGGHRDSILVVGKGIRVGETDNGDSWSLNGRKLNQPSRDYYNPRLWQDDKKEFISLETVKKEAIRINQKFRYYKNTDKIDVKYSQSYNNNKYIREVGIEGENNKSLNVLNLNFSAFKDYYSGYITDMDINGFKKGTNETLIINVDLKGTNSFKIPSSIIQYTDNTTASTGQVREWEKGNVIWNFYDSSKEDGIYKGEISNQGAVTGMIFAPGANVKIKHNINGTIVAENISIEGESHRSDFTGKTIEYPKESFNKGRFMIHKKNNSGSFLDNAKFKLTRVGTSYNEEKTSSNGGKVLFESLSPGNYTLEEIESPRGYTKSKETWNIKVENNGKTIIGDNTNSGTMDTPILEIINKKETSISEKGKGKFIINKTDGKKALDGAVFELKNNSNQSVIVPSSGEGSSKITFENLDPGTYTLKEKTPPAGYEKTNQEWTVTVDKDGFTKVEEKLSKSKKSRSQSSSERGAEKQFRSADLSSYILPKSARGLFDSNGFNFGNINPTRAGELDINQLYPRDNSPSPNFSYSEKDVTKNKRKNEKYKSTNEGDWYKYRGRDKYSSTNVAEINKYLVPTDKPGEYEVHLKVRGNTIEEKNSLGIVIVYDHSGSMSLSPNGWNSKSRFEVAKEATEGFLREILNPNNNNVQAALVTFGGDLFDGHSHKEGWYDDYSHFKFTNDPENIIDKMPGSPTKPNNQKAGTYTASGLKKAEELLRNSHFDKKVIITITDGIPTFSPAVEYAGIPRLNYGPKYGNGSRFPLDNSSYDSKDGVWIENHGQATIYQAQINKNAGIDMYTVGILIASEKGATEEDAHNVMRGIANPGKYFNSNKIGDIKKNLDRILVDLNHKTVNEGEINDPLGSQVEYNSNSGYELKKYRNGIEASDVSTRARVEYDNFNRKFKVSNLILGKDESCELIYKVNLKIEDSNFVSGNMYPTNGKATLKPYGKKDVNWRFPEPAISAKLRDIKLTKKWRKQNGSKPQDGTVTFQLQRKKSAEDDSKYKDVSSQNVTKNISDGDFEHTFKNLPPFNNKGEIYNYRIIETNIPVGYEPTTHEEGDNITITNKEIPEITVVNHPVKRYGKFIIEKEDDKGKPLGGAEFKLTNDKTGKQVEPTSGEGTPKITYEKLEEGSYTLEEVSSPAGYIRTTDKWTVTVDKDGFTRVEKSTKSSKSYSLDSSEESGKRQFRSASPSSYNIPRSLKSLYRGNIIPVSRSGNSMDGLYNENAQPNPGFDYHESSSGRTGEKYKNPKITNDFYNYKGNFKGKSVDVAGVNKYLEPTKKPGEYTVHLKVKGNTIKEENKIGVVVVYDNSGSMKGKKFRVAQNATKNFIRTLLKDNTNKNIEAALVSFNGYVLENATIDFTNSYEEFIAALPKDPDHGTNTTAGLVKADNLFEGKDFDKKIVVLITDGRPTYHPKVTRIIKSGEFSPRAEFSSSSKERKGDGRNYTLRKYKYRVGEDSIDNNGDPALYACNNMKSKGIEIHTVGVELQKEESDLSPEKARELMGKMASRDDYYYDTAEVDLLSDNLTKILEKIDMDTIEYGSIEDQIGEKVIFEENSYDIKGFKGGVPDNDITRYVYKNYDKNNKKLIISNLNLGENERCEITYKVHLDIENGNIKSGEFYKTNESATLTPHWQHNNIKWKFPEPAISATLKNVKLKKRWQNQEGSSSNDIFEFQLQRRVKGTNDYSDIGEPVKTKITGNKEFTHTFENLIPFNNNGEIYEYRVIEKGVPNGYDPIIDTDGEGNTDIINREIPVVKVKNKPNKVEFTKVNSIGQPLGGAIFKLQKEESTNTWKDVDRYKNITSNNLEAKIQMEKLAPGKYRLIETKAPEGFITPNNNQPVATFIVSNDGKVGSKWTNKGDGNNIINRPQAVDLTLFKYEGNESAQKPLRGATFKIYKNDSRPDKNNPTEEVIIKGVSEWMTNGDGEVTINGLTNGTYWLRETKPPEGYERIEGFIGKIIVKDGKLLYDKQPLYNDKGKSTQDNKIELKQNTLEIQNKKNYIELEKCYKDISGTEQPLNGAKFGLYKEVNNSYVQYLRENEHYIVSSGHTGEAGKFRFEKLEPGKYAVREEEAPLGFEKIDGNIITFTVKENGDYVDIENIQYNKISDNVCKIINKRKPMKFYIIKTDSNGLKLSDGILGVKIKDLKFNNGKDEKEFNLASDYEKYDSSGVQKEGLKIEVPVNTKSGTYTLKEIRAPQGFQLSNKEYKIRIDSENRRIELLGDKNSVKQVLYEENSNNSTIELGSPIEIKNKRVEYPNTGGIGTLLFTVIGGGLMAISSIFIMRKRRRI